MAEGAIIDARMRAALARLTDNEKQCLRRRLRQQTAKEMALELGISPHAVEKRLKMARTKLGLSSSLEAARLLVESERYQRTGPQAADLDVSISSGKKWLTRPLTYGVLAMSIVIAATIVLALQSGGVAPLSGGVAPYPEGGVAPISGSETPVDEPMKIGEVRRLPPSQMVPATAEEVRAFTQTMFASMDKDGSGFIERDEAPDQAVMITDARWEGNGPPPREWFEQQEFRPAPIEPDMSRAAFLAPYDSDADGKVSPEEFRQHTEPRVASEGVPKRWRDEYRSPS